MREFQKILFGLPALPRLSIIGEKSGLAIGSKAAFKENRQITLLHIVLWIRRKRPANLSITHKFLIEP